MPDIVTITRKSPAYQSMQYDFLREEGIKLIQDLSGDVWTDYNVHDPGITILEALCYAITDLGYRLSYPVKDLLARPLGSNEDIRNFYTARQILHNFPVTINDYRKLIIDVDVYEADSLGCSHAGVKNAWIELSTQPEIPFFLHESSSFLSYVPDITAPAARQPLPLNILYNVLLEFGTCDTYGDLNENFLSGDIVLDDPADPNLNGVTIRVEAELPRWDEEGVDWEDLESIRQNIKMITARFYDLPDGYSLTAYFDEINKNILLNGSVAGYPNPVPVEGIEEIELLIQDFIFNPAVPGLIYLYKAKVGKVKAILNKVKATLNSNRNLCEDFIRFSALKIEEILVCADIELTAEADVEAVEAKIFFEISKFLAPPVNFYSLEEMQGMDKESGKIYSQDEIRDTAVPKNLYSTEEIFDGPALTHGFIPDRQLTVSERRDMIHVSDLIRIIMAVDGVIAVRSIQIANRPQDNDEGIPEKSVKWCLELAVEKNYVPRLSVNDSKITFYKDQLPFRADLLEVETLLEDLADGDRPQKLYNPVLDIAIPAGEYKELEDYTSIQNDFPLNYGIGEDGLPASASPLRRAQAKQLKAYLMVFDQLLAGSFSQLEHVKDLFSLNAEKDIFGEYVIDRTYFNQPLFGIVPNSDALYVDKAGHSAELDKISESRAVFEERKNRFLDHLLARFAEQFADYALLSYKISGAKAPLELIEDKLAFLEAYPLLSSGRGKAFDYAEPARLWHVENISGLERRASLLAGINKRLPVSLAFSPAIVISGGPGLYGFRITGPGGAALISNHHYADTEKALLALEMVFINGLFKEKFEIDSEAPGEYYFKLLVEDDLIAVSEKRNYTSDQPGADADEAIDALISVISEEFYTNHEASRKNLACPIDNYFEAVIDLEMISSPPSSEPPKYSISFKFYGKSFDFTPQNALLQGVYTGSGEAKETYTILSAEIAVKTFSVEGDITDRLPTGKQIIVTGSAANDGLYTVVTASYGVNDTFIVVNEAINADNGDLGDLSFNVETEEGLLAKAEAKKFELFEEIISLGTLRNFYSFQPAVSPYTSPYRFQIRNRYAEVIASSVAFDFNEQLAQEIEDLSTGQVSVIDEEGHEHSYNVISAIASGPLITVETDPAPAQSTGRLSFTEQYSYSVSVAERKFIIAGTDLRKTLKKGNIISISGSESNDGDYTIYGVKLNGTDTEITVTDVIPAAVTPVSSGVLTYTKEFAVQGVSGNAWLIRGGADEEAVDEMISFLNERFNGHEGLHLVEHILLRPKVNGVFFAPADAESLTGGLSDNGILTYARSVPVSDISAASGSVSVGEDLSAEFTGGIEIELTGADINNGKYTVDHSVYDAVSNQTAVFVTQSIPADMSASGSLLYRKTTAITGIEAAGKSIALNDPGVLDLDEDAVIEILLSENGENDGRYTVNGVTDLSSSYAIEIKTAERLVQDNFLEINIDQECDACRIEDPYSCMASVILPYWPGRFNNRDFRKFFEKTLRMEAPAHVYLKICWINCQQMTEFEQKYKAWLIENARPEKDYARLSTTLNALIDILGRLRNIYPGGTLHDCEEDSTLQHSIILDHSVLGNA